MLLLQVRRGLLLLVSRPDRLPAVQVMVVVVVGLLEILEIAMDLEMPRPSRFPAVLLELEVDVEGF